MILQFSKGCIDIAESEEVNLKIDSFRFSGIRDSYTTDFTIPATINNLKILGCYGLLDRDQYVSNDAILISNGEYIEVSVEVTSVTDKEICLCCYEKNWNSDLSDKIINDSLTDTHATILEWNSGSVTKYPDNFLRYSYGMSLNTKYAQYHPVIKLNDLTGIINSDINTILPMVDQNIYTIATKKTVCPQNRVQVFEANLSDMKNTTFKLRGGQHVSNDLCWSMTNSITFNRSVRFNMQFTIVWQRKNTTSSDFYININKNDQTYRMIRLQSSGPHAKCIYPLHTGMTASDTDTFTLTLSNPEKFKNITIVCRIEYYNYDIYDDDYGTELEYVYRRPQLYQINYTNNSGLIPFDGSVHPFYNEDGDLIANVSTSSLSFSYFGILTNIPEISIKDYATALAWYTDKKIKLTNNNLLLNYPYNTTEIYGYIEEKCPVSDIVGQKTCIKFTNESIQLSQIDNKFLEKEKNIVELNVYNPKALSSITLEIGQYKNPEVDENAVKYTCEFIDTGFVIGYTTNNQSLAKINLENNFGIRYITKCLECTIITKDDVRESDYVLLDGRKYMIISIDHDLETNLNTLKTLLV